MDVLCRCIKVYCTLVAFRILCWMLFEFVFNLFRDSVYFSVVFYYSEFYETLLRYFDV